MAVLLGGTQPAGAASAAEVALATPAGTYVVRLDAGRGRLTKPITAVS